MKMERYDVMNVFLQQLACSQRISFMVGYRLFRKPCGSWRPVYGTLPCKCCALVSDTMTHACIPIIITCMHSILITLAQMDMSIDEHSLQIELFGGLLMFLHWKWLESAFRPSHPTTW